MSDKRLTYTPPQGPHGHWQITDENGTVLACPHQEPAPELLALLDLTPGGTPEPVSEPTPEAPAKPVESDGPATRDEMNPAPQTPTPTPEARPETTGPVEGPVPTPPLRPTEQVWSTATGSTTTNDDSPYAPRAFGELKILPQAAEVAISKGFTRAQLTEAVEAPDRVKESRNDATVRTKGDIRVVVAPDGLILRVETAYRSGPYTPPRPAGPRRAGARQAPRPPLGDLVPDQAQQTRPRDSGPLWINRFLGGGTGRKADTRVPVPTTVREFEDLLRAHGFQIAPGGKHQGVTHPAHPGLKSTLPVSPSDNRWAHNQISQVRAMFGIDLRRPPEGTKD